jgi:hypothetical protein
LSRFRETTRRLQASLVETHRSGSKVRHEHVAGLGSVPRPPSPSDRIVFWTKLRQRLDALSNRIDAAQREAICLAIVARIPPPTMDEFKADQLERAKVDAQSWDTIAEMQRDHVKGHKGLLASTQKAIAKLEPLAADTAQQAQGAKDRLARAERGELVAGIKAPMTRKALLRLTGMTESDLRHAQRMNVIADQGGWDLMFDEEVRRKRLVEKRVVSELYHLLRPRGSHFR